MMHITARPIAEFTQACQTGKQAVADFWEKYPDDNGLLIRSLLVLSTRGVQMEGVVPYILDRIDWMSIQSPTWFDVFAATQYAVILLKHGGVEWKDRLAFLWDNTQPSPTSQPLSTALHRWDEPLSSERLAQLSPWINMSLVMLRAGHPMLDSLLDHDSWRQTVRVGLAENSARQITRLLSAAHSRKQLSPLLDLCFRHQLFNPQHKAETLDMLIQCEMMEFLPQTLDPDDLHSRSEFRADAHVASMSWTLDIIYSDDNMELLWRTYEQVKDRFPQCCSLSQSQHDHLQEAIANTLHQHMKNLDLNSLSADAVSTWKKLWREVLSHDCIDRRRLGVSLAGALGKMGPQEMNAQRSQFLSDIVPPEVAEQWARHAAKNPTCALAKIPTVQNSLLSASIPESDRPIRKIHRRI